MNQKNLNIIFGSILFILVIIIAVLFVENRNIKYTATKLDETLKVMKDRNELLNIQNTDNSVISEATDLSKLMGYYHEKYGFSIYLPRTWNGYVAQEKKLSWGDAGTSDSLDFGFKDQERMFNIVMLRPEQWLIISKSQGPKPIYIDENQTYVFAYSIAQDYSDKYKELAKDIPDIIKKFEVIYQNAEGDYEFQCSKDWDIKFNGSTTEINGGKFAAIGVIDSHYGTSIDEYMKYIISRKANIVSKEDVTIQGLPALKVELLNYQPEGLYYFIERNKKVYFIHLMDNYTAGDFEKFNLILKSFRFMHDEIIK